MKKEKQTPGMLQELVRKLAEGMSEVERGARRDIDSYLIQSSSAMPSKQKDELGNDKAA